MAAFSFVILVATGIYLGLIYAPSNVEITTEAGETLPEAYASVQLIESIPVANLFRNVHHWAAHLMVVSVLLHLIRVYFYGTYRKPREINWVIGIALLTLTLVAGFVGYSLPYDSYAVTATGIGFSIARSIPWVGDVASDLFFGGAFPTLGSLPRLYTIHVFIVPALIAGAIGLHLLVVIKQKHTQPGYARKLAEPGRVLGVPLWPYQALLAGQLLLLMFGGLCILSALVPVHPLDAYGPPTPETPEVKPDWYLLWIYGFLKIVPQRGRVLPPRGDDRAGVHRRSPLPRSHLPAGHARAVAGPHQPRRGPALRVPRTAGPDPDPGHDRRRGAGLPRDALRRRLLRRPRALPWPDVVHLARRPVRRRRPPLRRPQSPRAAPDRPLRSPRRGPRPRRVRNRGPRRARPPAPLGRRLTDGLVGPPPQHKKAPLSQNWERGVGG